MSCPDCFTGSIHLNAEPTGTILNLYGRQTYVANPPTGTDPKGIVIIIPDAFGLPFPNNQLLADTVSSSYSPAYPVPLHIHTLHTDLSTPSMLAKAHLKSSSLTSWTAPRRHSG